MEKFNAPFGKEMIPAPIWLLEQRQKNIDSLTRSYKCLKTRAKSAETLEKKLEALKKARDKYLELHEARKHFYDEIEAILYQKTQAFCR